MKIYLLLLFILIGCNSKEPEMTPLAGIQDPGPSVPYITSISIADGDYVTGNTLSFIVNFSEPISVIGSPTLNFVTESGTYSATTAGGTFTTSLLFTHAVVAANVDSNGIALTGSLSLSGGSIYDPILDEDARLTYAIPVTTGVRLNPSAPGVPYITSFPIITGSMQPSGFYELGMHVYVDVSFSQAVTVTGTPSLGIRIGTNPSGTLKQMSYFSGSGTSTLRFRYIVGATDFDNDGIMIDSSSPQLTVSAINTIRAGGVDANPVYTPPAAMTLIKIDGSLGPNITAYPITAPIGIYRHNGQLQFILDFDRPVKVTGGTPALDIDIGGVARSATWVSDGGNPTSQHRFIYTVNDATPNVDLDGVAVTGLSSFGSQFSDSFGAVVPSISNASISGVTDALVATNHVTQWYDLKRNQTVSVGSTTTLVQFSDILASGTNGNLNGSIPYNRTSGFIDFTANTQYIVLNPTFVSLKYVLLVIDSKDQQAGSILYNAFDNKSLLDLGIDVGTGNGFYSSVACALRTCSYLDSTGTWKSTGTGDFSDISSANNEKKVIVIDYNALPTVAIKLSNNSTARIYEMVIVSDSVTQAQISILAQHLKNKHSGTF